MEPVLHRKSNLTDEFGFDRWSLDTPAESDWGHKITTLVLDSSLASTSETRRQISSHLNSPLSLSHPSIALSKTWHYPCSWWMATIELNLLLSCLIWLFLAYMQDGSTISNATTTSNDISDHSCFLLTAQSFAVARFCLLAPVHNSSRVMVRYCKQDSETGFNYP